MNAQLMENKNQIDSISTIYTLGPSGTNCEMAANKWFDKVGKKKSVKLFKCLEDAVKLIIAEDSKETALLSCVVYPSLHSIVFNNLKKMQFVDIFLCNTYDMLLATSAEHNNSIEQISTIYSHPAPVSLAPIDKEIVYVNSNVEAAMMCLTGNTNSACITTEKAAKNMNMRVLASFGEVPMGFALHCLK